MPYLNGTPACRPPRWSPYFNSRSFNSMLQERRRRPSWSTNFTFGMCVPTHVARVAHRLPPPRRKLPPLMSRKCRHFRHLRRRGEITITLVCRHSQISPTFYLVALQLCRLSNMDTFRHVLLIKLNHVPTCLVACSRKTMPPFHLLTSLPVSSQGSRCQPCRISFPPNSISAQAVRTAATVAIHHLLRPM